MKRLRAPFPWFGGKSRAADLIWEGLGDVGNYVEPFAGSLAVLLGRPTAPRTETVNDLDCYVANFWRALAADPSALAAAADWPVNEADLHARHRWLVDQEGFRDRIRSDPEFYDVRVAGWWVWGLSCWIGGGWCATGVQANGEVPSEQARRPQLLTAKGVHRKSLAQQIPEVSASGTGDAIRRGVVAIQERRPRLDGREGRPHNGYGVHRIADRAAHKVMLSGNGHGVGVHSNRRHALVDEFHTLAQRLRGVRVVCGDWKRVLTPSVTTGHGVTGVVLDPPYDQKERAGNIYACESQVSAEVRRWAIEHGDDEQLRIVLCGYEGEHAMPRSWRVVEWKAAGGYGRKKGNQNRHRERLWFSPACQAAAQGGLFA